MILLCLDPYFDPTFLTWPVSFIHRLTTCIDMELCLCVTFLVQNNKGIYPFIFFRKENPFLLWWQTMWLARWLEAESAIKKHAMYIPVQNAQRHTSQMWVWHTTCNSTQGNSHIGAMPVRKALLSKLTTITTWRSTREWLFPAISAINVSRVKWVYSIISPSTPAIISTIVLSVIRDLIGRASWTSMSRSVLWCL